MWADPGDGRGADRRRRIARTLGLAGARGVAGVDQHELHMSGGRNMTLAMPRGSPIASGPVRGATFPMIGTWTGRCRGEERRGGGSFPMIGKSAGFTGPEVELGCAASR